MQIHVTVTQEDIDKGCPGLTQACPIARAIDRICPDYEVFVCASQVILQHKLEKPSLRAEMPFEAMRFVKAFDGALRYHEIHPFEFDLNFYEVRARYPKKRVLHSVAH